MVAVFKVVRKQIDWQSVGFFLKVGQRTINLYLVRTYNLRHWRRPLRMINRAAGVNFSRDLISF